MSTVSLIFATWLLGLLVGFLLGFLGGAWVAARVLNHYIDEAILKQACPHKS